MNSSLLEPASYRTPAGRRIALLRSICFVAFYAILANLPFWIAGRSLGILANGWLSLDYIAVGLLSLYLPRIAAAFLLLLAICLDVLAGICETYFFSPEQCFTNLDGLRDFSPERHFTMGAVALMVLAVAFAVPYLLAPVERSHRARIAVCLAAFAALCIAFDCVNLLEKTGKPPAILAHPERYTTNADVKAAGVRLSRIPAIRLTRQEIFPTVIGKPMVNASSVGLRALAATKGAETAPNFVLILVESWGQDSEAAVRHALVEPYDSPALQARYQVAQGMVPFNGPTAVGEARELCASTMSYHIMIAAPRELKNCLPRELISQGYHAVALHGMEGSFYDRQKWWRNIGFQEIWFEEEFKPLGMPIYIGSFAGIYDSALADWMVRKLQQDKARPDFLYWVTLNSHLPVTVPSHLQNGASCAFTPSLAEQPSLCSWYQLEAQAHHSIASLAMADLGRPTIFIIVGDHAPPFSDPSLRGRFAPDTVPYVLLTPRELQPVSASAPPGR